MIPWAQPSPQPNGRFCTDDRRVSLYFTMGRPMGRPFSPQNRPFPWGIWTPSNTWFLGPTRVPNLNGISIGAAVFAGLTSVSDRRTDRLTDHATRSVTIGRIYVRSTALRPNNNTFLIIIITTASMSMFVMLSARHSHCESSTRSFDERRLSALTLRTSQPTCTASLHAHCYRPRSPSPFIIIIITTQNESTHFTVPRRLKTYSVSTYWCWSPSYVLGALTMWENNASVWTNAILHFFQQQLSLDTLIIRAALAMMLSGTMC